MRNIHIHPSPLLHASRILKETKTLLQQTAINEILLVGMAGNGLADVQTLANGLTIHRLSPGKGGGTGLLKMVRYFLWYLRVLKFCFARQAQVVNCHTLWVLPIGVVLKLLTKCKLVYDAHELETQTLGGNARLRPRLECWIERLCMRTVDLLIVVSPGIEAWYRQQYGKAINAVTILNVPVYENALRSDRLREALRLTQTSKIVLYQGMLGARRGIEFLLKAAPTLKESGYELVFMGHGSWVEKIKPYVEQSVCHLHPSVASDVLLEYTASADFGIHLIPDDCLNHHLCLPNKLFEYLMAGLPVLVSGLPEIRNILDERNIGLCTENFEPDDILTALKQLEALRRAPDFHKQIENFKKTYNWKKQEQKMVHAYQRHILG